MNTVKNTPVYRYAALVRSKRENADLNSCVFFFSWEDGGNWVTIIPSFVKKPDYEEFTVYSQSNRLVDISFSPNRISITSCVGDTIHTFKRHVIQPSERTVTPRDIARQIWNTLVQHFDYISTHQGTQS